MKRVDLEVPKGDRELLIVPDARELPGLVRANRERIRGYDFAFCGRPVRELRDVVRREIMTAAHRYTASLGVSPPERSAGPIVMTGHQPEFYHPGVWVKNHVTARLAEAADGVGLNLVVDNDVPREGELAFPVHGHTGWTRHEMPFAEIDSSRAYEEHTDKTSWRFDHLAGEVTELLPLEDAEPLITRFMDDASGCMREASDVAHLMTLLRRRYEEKIGLANLEIPASALSDTKGFALFVLGIAAEARRFAQAYNDAVGEYRRVYGLRGKSHPVPDLGVEESRVELPFWVWSPGGERQRLWIAPNHPATLLIDESSLFTVDENVWQGIVAGEEDAFDAAAERLLGEGKGKFKIRPRAISNTMFARIFLSDVFIHGVGGAKYDAITDEIIRRFFDVEPPDFITCSATLFLPIDVATARQEDLRRLRWELRDSFYNADRHMDETLRASEPVEALVAEKRELVQHNEKLRERPRHEPRSLVRSRRRDIFLDIRNHNRQLTALIEPHLRSLREELAHVESHVGDEAVVKHRGYPFVLYPEDQLLDFYNENISV
ncbi:MAG: hypothetical protein AMS16_06350 [Planctomycetes bacterium DG_58]|nr:MAG: hypothetical protein AMS16_06350 [Planctomycetes bacterium DG_58]